MIQLYYLRSNKINKLDEIWWCIDESSWLSIIKTWSNALSVVSGIFLQWNRWLDGSGLPKIHISGVFHNISETFESANVLYSLSLCGLWYVWKSPLAPSSVTRIRDVEKIANFDMLSGQWLKRKKKRRWYLWNFNVLVDEACEDDKSLHETKLKKMNQFNKRIII